MLQSSMRSQLARLKLHIGFIQKRTIMDPKSLGPMQVYFNGAKEQLKLTPPENKHWSCSGNRSIAIAVELLRDGKVIAIPTDTIYGIAASAENNDAIEKIYRIKGRDENKPLAICVNNVNDVKNWGLVDDITHDILVALLPGPYTIILKRLPTLNPNLNPGIDTVGIRVPDSKFVRSVTKFVGPLALTSANRSNNESSLKPDEFSELWSDLDGIFYGQNLKKRSYYRKGSTIVDLSKPGYYSIARSGLNLHILENTLQNHGLKLWETKNV